MQSTERCSGGGGVVELDTNLGLDLFKKLLAAAVAIIVAVSTEGIGNGPAAGLIVGVATMNGNDNLGIFAGKVPANDKVDLVTTGGTDGKGTLTFEGVVDTLFSQGCAGSSATDTSGTGASVDTSTTNSSVGFHQSDSDRIFGPLRETTFGLASIGVESGNPASLTANQLSQVRATLSSYAVGIAEVAAGVVVSKASRFQGADQKGNYSDSS